MDKYFGLIITISIYYLLSLAQRKFKFLNPLLFTIISIILILKIFNIPIDYYNKSSDKVDFFLSLSTICLALPLYRQYNLLKKHLLEILVSIGLGTIAGLISIYLMAKIFNFSKTLYISILPKSITSAFAYSLSSDNNAMASVTIIVVIITGIVGSIISKQIFKLLKIKHPIAIGLALGTSSHAVGTAKAIEYGEIETAMSSLSIVVAAFIVILFFPIFIILW